MMRRNVDVIAVAVVVVLAAVWDFVGHSGLANAIASGQLQIPDRIAQVVIHQPHVMPQFHCY
jgi:hypothetical protein